MIVLSSGKARAPEHAGGEHGKRRAHPADERDLPDRTEGIQAPHEHAAVDHRLLHPLHGMPEGRLTRRGLAMDRVHDHAGDEVGLGPQPGLGEHGRQDGGEPALRDGPRGHGRTRPEGRDPRGRRPRRPRRPASPDGPGRPERPAPGRQAQPGGHRLVEAEEDEHASHEFHHGGVRRDQARGGAVTQEAQQDARFQQHQAAEDVGSADDQRRGLRRQCLPVEVIR